jgi:hypothetical protein
MDAATVAALFTGLAAVIAAVGALVAQVRHQADTTAHTPKDSAGPRL